MDARAPKVLICPTFESVFGTIIEPIKKPRKYPPIMMPVIRLLFPVVEARTPRRTSWIPFPIMINARPKKRGHVDKRDRNI